MRNPSDVDVQQVSRPSSEVHQLIEFEEQAGVELGAAERLLLVTDGTVTHMLEALTREPVEVSIIERKEEHGVLDRQVRLETTSGEVLLWARSEIELKHLPELVRTNLVNGDIGIGRALRNAGIDTRREIGSFDFIPADHQQFPSFVSDQQNLIKRTYRVHTSGTRVMTITEYFSRRHSWCR